MVAKACIFDFDGTVMDSEKYHHLAWQQVAHEIGTEFSYEEYMPMKSAGRQVVIPYLLKKAGKQCTPQLLEFYCEFRQQKIVKALMNLNENDVMPGFVQFAQLLRKNGIKCGVASSSAAATDTAKRFGLMPLFDAFVDGNDKLPSKPAPDIFLHTAKLLQTPPSQCVVFEDSINGLTAAKRAGMFAVGIQTYFCDVADKIVNDFCEANLQTITF